MNSFFYNFQHLLKRIYWFILRPKTKGVKCIILYKGKVLMIRKTLTNSKFVFPGGAVKDGESLEESVIREIEEDLGLKLKKVKPIGEFTSEIFYRTETIYCFVSKLDSVNRSEERRVGKECRL